jgi:hypothetical protein
MSANFRILNDSNINILRLLICASGDAWLQSAPSPTVEVACKVEVDLDVAVAVAVVFDLDVKSAWALCPYREESLPCKAMSFRRRAAVPHEFPATPLPLMWCRNRIRNETCLSAASSFRFPILALQQREAAGQRLAAAFLWLTFLWRSKEK